MIRWGKRKKNTQSLYIPRIKAQPIYEDIVSWKAAQNRSCKGHQHLVYTSPINTSLPWLSNHWKQQPCKMEIVLQKIVSWMRVYKLHNEIDHDQINYCKLHFSFSASSSCFKASIRSTKAINSWKFQDRIRS